MRLLILIILLTMSSCEKDELIVNGVITLPKITESKKVSKPTLKKKENLDYLNKGNIEIQNLT
jgi:hypothetical protein